MHSFGPFHCEKAIAPFSHLHVTNGAELRTTNDYVSGQIIAPP